MDNCRDKRRHREDNVACLFEGSRMKRASRPRGASNLSESISHQLNMYALAASAAGVSELSESTYRRLNMYALAASAAGVSLLALIQPSEAKIVYTRANIGLGSGVQLDLNHDGKTDFYILDQTNYGKNSFCNVEPGRHNQIMGTGNQAAALRAGVRVGSKGQFAASHTVLARFWKKSDTGTSYSTGQWRNVKNHYLGLRFVIQGKIHYGWARMTVIVNHGIGGVLTGYAYETIPNKPIITGDIIGDEKALGENGAKSLQPASVAAPASEPVALGLLARGWPGLSVWRRE